MTTQDQPKDQIDTTGAADTGTLPPAPAPVQYLGDRPLTAVYKLVAHRVERYAAKELLEMLAMAEGLGLMGDDVYTFIDSRLGIILSRVAPDFHYEATLGDFTVSDDLLLAQDFSKGFGYERNIGSTWVAANREQRQKLAEIEPKLVREARMQAWFRLGYDFVIHVRAVLSELHKEVGEELTRITKEA